MFSSSFLKTSSQIKTKFYGVGRKDPGVFTKTNLFTVRSGSRSGPNIAIT